MLSCHATDVRAASGAAGGVTPLALARANRYTERRQPFAQPQNCGKSSSSYLNLVIVTVANHPAAYAVLGRLQDPIAGCPDDAVLFMYLN